MQPTKILDLFKHPAFGVSFVESSALFATVDSNTANVVLRREVLCDLTQTRLVLPDPGCKLLALGIAGQDHVLAKVIVTDDGLKSIGGSLAALWEKHATGRLTIVTEEVYVTTKGKEVGKRTSNLEIDVAQVSVMVFDLEGYTDYVYSVVPGVEKKDIIHGMDLARPGDIGYTDHASEALKQFIGK